MGRTRSRRHRPLAAITTATRTSGTAVPAVYPTCAPDPSTPGYPPRHRPPQLCDPRAARPLDTLCCDPVRSPACGAPLTQRSKAYTQSVVDAVASLLVGRPAIPKATTPPTAPTRDPKSLDLVRTGERTMREKMWQPGTGYTSVWAGAGGLTCPSTPVPSFVENTVVRRASAIRGTIDYRSARSAENKEGVFVP